MQSTFACARQRGRGAIWTGPGEPRHTTTLRGQGQGRWPKDRVLPWIAGSAIVFLVSLGAFASKWDLAQVDGIEWLHNPTAQAALASNGFVVLPESTYDSLVTAYAQLEHVSLPVFVSVDLILHVAHLLFDQTLREAEVLAMRQALLSLSDQLVRLSAWQCEASGSALVREAARRNVAFFAVGGRLLGLVPDVPEDVATLVDDELTLIDAHAGWASSPILAEPSSSFDYIQDYSQFVPRGHYTGNTDLESYFLAMMWYGRMLMPLPNEGWPVDDFLKRTTLQALLVNQLLADSPMHVPLIDRWEALDGLIAFFVESSDDLTVRDYLPLMQEVYGDGWSQLSALEDESSLLRFIAAARELREPRIESGILPNPDGAEYYRNGFKFLGQSGVPDAWVFDRLVSPYVGDPSNRRLMPKGLDVMAALGSAEAEAILREEGDFDHQNYGVELATLQGELASLPSDQWTETLYWSWLAALRALIDPQTPSGAVPAFMETAAWRRKTLSTALASWAELRHDTLLYVKQPYSLPLVAAPWEAYLEPCPETYRALATLIARLRGRLEEVGLSPGLVAALVSFGEVLSRLERIAANEVRGLSLTYQDGAWLRSLGGQLGTLLAWVIAPSSPGYREADERMMVVADVFTQINTRETLEVSVGYPWRVYAVIPFRGTPTLAMGWVFSYYEFPWPMEDRLTDEAWQEMLAAGVEPAMPAWAASFTGRPGQERGGE